MMVEVGYTDAHQRRRDEDEPEQAQRLSQPGEAPEGETMTIPVCSFCKRPGPKVSYLVQGLDNLLICDNCVAASVDTVAKKDRGWRDRQIDHLLSLRNVAGYGK